MDFTAKIRYIINQVSKICINCTENDNIQKKMLEKERKRGKEGHSIEDVSYTK